jgi:hypothetical protein
VYAEALQASTNGSQILMASGSILFYLEVQPDKLQFRYFTLEALQASANGSQILVASGSILFYLEVQPDKLQFRYCPPEALQASALPRFMCSVASSSSNWSSRLTHCS